MFFIFIVGTYTNKVEAYITWGIYYIILSKMGVIEKK